MYDMALAAALKEHAAARTQHAAAQQAAGERLLAATGGLTHDMRVALGLPLSQALSNERMAEATVAEVRKLVDKQRREVAGARAAYRSMVDATSEVGALGPWLQETERVVAQIHANMAAIEKSLTSDA